MSGNASERLSAWLGKFRPRSALVREAQIGMLLRQSRYQAIVAPCLAVFLTASFAEKEAGMLPWLWLGGLLVAYGTRLAFIWRTGNRPASGSLESRLNFYLVGLGISGLFWASAPHALAMPGSHAQLIVAIFVAFAILVGVLGNFLYYKSALVYFAAWIVPALVSLGFVYTTHFHDEWWSYGGVVALFLLYAFKCLEVINLPLCETLELNEALTIEKERAEASDRAKTDFLAMMSHELRTPLNAIMGYSEVIRDRMFGTDAQQRYVEQAARIREAAGLLNDLISDVLELSALEAGGRRMRIEPVRIGDVVESSVRLLDDEASKKGIAVETDIPGSLPVLPVDRRAAVQCVTNILGNALKYAPEGSRIGMEAEDAGAFVRLVVADSGPGIPATEIDEVTEPFRRGSIAETTRAKGAGLGLSIAVRLMKLQNGYLELSSTEGRGTTVALYFPVTANADVQDGETAARRAAR